MLVSVRPSASAISRPEKPLSGHHDRGPRVVGQDGERRQQRFADLLPQDLDLGGDLGLLGGTPLEEPPRDDRPPATTRGQVGADAVQPCCHVVRLTSGGMFLDESEERLLDEVVSRVRIAGQGVCEAREPALVRVVGGHDEVGAEYPRPIRQPGV